MNSTDPEGGGSDEADVGEEVLCLFVVSCGDGRPFFQMAEGTLDDVASLIGDGVEVHRPASGWHGRAYGGAAMSGEEGAHIVGVIRLVGDRSGSLTRAVQR